MTNIGTAFVVVFFLVGAVAALFILVAEFGRRLREGVSESLNQVRVEMRAGFAEQDGRHARTARRLEEIETDMLELLRAQRADVHRIDSALDAIARAVAKATAQQGVRKRRAAKPGDPSTT